MNPEILGSLVKVEKMKKRRPCPTCHVCREARCAAMARSSLFLLLSLSPLVASSAAWLSRRALLCSSAGALLAPPALAVPARTGPNSVFNGEYDDPKHPGCLRSIKVGSAQREHRAEAGWVMGRKGLGRSGSVRPKHLDCLRQRKVGSAWQERGIGG